MNIKWGYNTINGDYVFAKTQIELEKYKKNNPNRSIVDLGVGDVKFSPPKEVCKALVDWSKKMANLKTFLGYGDEQGDDELRRLIAVDYNNRGINVEKSEIFITNGAKNGLSELMQIATFKQALIFNPTYPLYAELCSLYGIKTKIVDENCNLNKKLSGLVGKNACDIVFLCSPNNPTGKVFSLKKLRQLINYVNLVKGVLIIDCAYAAYCKYFLSALKIENSERVIEVHSFSKSISYTGIRCGYTIIKKKNPFYEPYKKYLSLHTNGVNIIAQKGAIAFFDKKCKSKVQKRIDYYRTNAKILKEPFVNAGIKVLGGVNAPYLFCNVKNKNFAGALLSECGVVVTNGGGFGKNGWIRISCLGKKENAIEGAKRIEVFLKTKGIIFL